MAHRVGQRISAAKEPAAWRVRRVREASAAGAVVAAAAVLGIAGAEVGVADAAGAKAFGAGVADAAGADVKAFEAAEFGCGS